VIVAAYFTLETCQDQLGLLFFYKLVIEDSLSFKCSQ